MAIINGDDQNNTLLETVEDDLIQGFGGDDILQGRNGDDTLIGGFGDDQISGGDGADTLSGGEGSDTISGGTGDDTILLEGVIQNETIDGNIGRDRIVIDLADRSRLITLSNSQIRGAGTTEISGIEEIHLRANTPGRSHRIDASAFSGDVTLEGGTARDTLTAGTGDDVLLGGLGRDLLITRDGLGRDRLDGGADNDRFLVTEGSHEIIGGAGVDTITNSAIEVSGPLVLELSNVSLSINGEVSTVQGIEQGSFGGGQASDQINTEFFAGDVNINGNAGNDVIKTGIGNDFLLGRSGDDDIFSNFGDDFIAGGRGNDTLFGSNGDDELIGDQGNDSLIGGNQNDTLSGAGFASSVGDRDTLNGGFGSDLFILGESGGDNPIVHYDDGIFFNFGSDDFALIEDFESSVDQIQLVGIASQYRTRTTSVDGILGVGIFRFDPVGAPGVFSEELIAVVQGTNRLNLNSSDFVFV